MQRNLIPLSLLLAGTAAQAGVTLYTNEAAYLAAVGATRAYTDFAGSPAATVSGNSFLPEVTFGSCPDSSDPISCGSQVLHNSDAITDLGGSAANNGVGSLAWRFNLADVFAFGFHYVSGAIDAVALVDSLLNVDLVDTTAASGFIGLVSDQAFYGGIGINGVFPNNIGNDRYFIDDFRINGIGAVPEPGAAALAVLALAAAGLTGRRAGAAKVSPSPAA